MPEIHKYNSTKFERLISENAAKIKNSEYGQKYYKQHFNILKSQKAMVFREFQCYN